MKENHAVFIQRCFDLAQRGIGHVAPNPLVGAVLVYDGKIISEGWHQKYGEAHAEVNCLKNVKEADKHLIEKSTLYVNLEPCSHYGKTPPCADLVIANKIPKLVFANTDPNPLVAGKGLEKLKKAGVEVLGPILEKEGAYLNKRFFTFQQQKRPYIILKWAQSKDGFINQTAGIQNWITGEEAKTLVHQWRFEEAAILVGSRTVEVDNPQLNNRLFPGENNPLRIVIDINADLDFSQYKMGNDKEPVLIFNTKISKKEGQLEWIKIDQNDFLQTLVQNLFERNIQSLIVEGGAYTLNQFIANDIWDEARVFTGTKLFKEGLEAPKLSTPFTDEYPVGKDQLSIYYRS